MKTMTMKSLMLVAMLAMTTAMYAKTAPKHNTVNEPKMEIRHDKGCKTDKRGHHSDKHCKCLCHKPQPTCKMQPSPAQRGHQTGIASSTRNNNYMAQATVTQGRGHSNTRR